ncbi:MAG: hypothetical protein ACTSWA_01295, partial [Candidatus Thorarchaeota archaeon]
MPKSTKTTKKGSKPKKKASSKTTKKSQAPKKKSTGKKPVPKKKTPSKKKRTTSKSKVKKLTSADEIAVLKELEVEIRNDDEQVSLGAIGRLGVMKTPNATQVLIIGLK